MNILTQQLPENTLGRDFVIGPLHGEFSVLRKGLDAVNFDTSIDRLFSVGDLIDFGPEPLSCLDLLKNPWFYCVQAPQEHLLAMSIFERFGDPDLQSITRKARSERIARCSGWFDEYGHAVKSPKEWLDLGLLLLRQPHLIAVGSGDKRFHVVHSELIDQNGSLVSDSQIHPRLSPAGVSRITGALFDAADFPWKRTLYNQWRAESSAHQRGETYLQHFTLPASKQTLVYCGQGRVPVPTLFRGHLMLHTGCGAQDKGAALTIVEHGSSPLRISTQLQTGSEVVRKWHNRANLITLPTRQNKYA